MTSFVQRQISAFCGVGSEADPINYSVAERSWAQQDIYPSKILKLADGKVENDTIAIGPLGTAALPLPQDYDPARRLFAIIRSTETVKCSVTSAEPASDVLIRSGAAADQDGILSFIHLGVTSIVIYNPQAAATTIEFMFFEYPADITNPDAWRDGSLTTGTVTT